MENNYICKKHKRKVEEQKPKCKYCELDKLPDTSNRKYQIDKETILKIDGKEYTLIWNKERNNGVGAYYCPALELYLERFGDIKRGKGKVNIDIKDDRLEEHNCEDGCSDCKTFGEEDFDPNPDFDRT